MPVKIKAVIFDMDGVLIDAKDWHYEALNRALAHFGFTISRYDHLVTFDGLPTRKKLEMLTRERGLPVALHDFLNRLKQAYTMEIVHARRRPRFQHEYTLSRLKAAKYKLAVASNSVRDSVETMMSYSDLRKYLDVVVSNEDVKVGKPDPEIYLRTMALLGFEPGECLVVEDNDKGIESAMRAGGRLLVVKEVTDVTYDCIEKRIRELEVT